MVGRKVWVLETYAGQVLTSGPFQVLSIKQVLGAGHFTRQTLNGIVESNRKRTLVQFWSDGGIRTVAAASVWTKDPGKATSPW